MESSPPVFHGRTTGAGPPGHAADAPPGRLIAVDPGLQRTGFAVIQPTRDGTPRLIEAGVVRLSRTATLAERLVELEQNLAELIQTHRPATLACEELYAHYKHPRTAILMGHARGVVLALAARCELQILPVAATHAKKWITGRGHASKEQVQRAVASTLGLAEVPEPHDVADAIAIALAAVRMRAALAIESGVASAAIAHRRRERAK